MHVEYQKNLSAINKRQLQSIIRVRLNKVLIVVIAKCLTKIKQATAFSTYILYFIATKADLNGVSK